MKVTPDEERWLTLHGDRDFTHVAEDDIGKYVLMYHPLTEDRVEKVYFSKKSALDLES